GGGGGHRAEHGGGGEEGSAREARRAVGTRGLAPGPVGASSCRGQAGGARRRRGTVGGRRGTEGAPAAGPRPGPPWSATNATTDPGGGAAHLADLVSYESVTRLRHKIATILPVSLGTGDLTPRQDEAVRRAATPTRLPEGVAGADRRRAQRWRGSPRPRPAMISRWISLEPP